MHKTGTTFLQQNVFPKFEGITYLRDPVIDQFLRLDDDRNYLASNERLAGPLWGTRAQSEATIRRLAEMFPDAKILISFRPHHRFIVSSYKQYLHEGGSLPFERYFDVDEDNGFMKKEQFVYKVKIDAIRRRFGSEPFVFLHDEVLHDLGGLLADFERYLGAKAPALSEIRIEKVNRGVKFYPSRLLRRLNALERTRFNPEGRLHLNNRFTRALKIDPRRICQYWLAFLPDREFLTEEQRKKIADHYRDDWAYVERLRSMRLSPSPAEACA
jgi:hypothetical protein